MKILCTICARSKSKGIKNKNLLYFNNLPLVSYTVKYAKKTKIFTKIVISSDSSKILNITKNQKPDLLIKRPKKYSNDKAKKILAIRHALFSAEKKFKIKFDYIIDLDVTSPVRKITDVKSCLKRIIKEKNEILVTAIPSKKNPYFNMIEFNKKNKLKRVKNLKKKIHYRQNVPKVYDMNASIYIWKRKALVKNDDLFYGKTSLYVMKNTFSLDIDNISDYKILKFYENKYA